MYIPISNLMEDKEETIAFMKRFSFATIITATNNFPVATHLPFLVTLKGDDIILTSHFAKVNPQWKAIEGNDILVIFSEPHAYISPSNYEKEQNVPTWNYIAVHSYGKGTLVTEPTQVMKILEATINNYEAAYKQQWDGLSDKYKEGMMNGIVAFEILVTDLQGKKKLSQNKSQAEQQKIIQTLSKSMDSSERVIGEYMERELTPAKSP